MKKACITTLVLFLTASIIFFFTKGNPEIDNETSEVLHELDSNNNEVGVPEAVDLKQAESFHIPDQLTHVSPNPTSEKTTDPPHTEPSAQLLEESTTTPSQEPENLIQDEEKPDEPTPTLEEYSPETPDEHGRIKLFEFEGLSYYKNFWEVLMEGTVQDSLFAINSEKEIQWQFAPEHWVGHYRIDPENKVVFLGNDSYQDLEGVASGRSEIYALDLKTGEKLWEYETGGYDWGFELFGDFLIFGTQDGTIHCLEKQSGIKKWA
ncbi:MAG: PQQ-binding-like beta-propeller repeat protein, partial [bacterium]|nr:PQQ-binding-like beta-propeller repeat protein [bacterium]